MIMKLPEDAWIEIATNYESQANTGSKHYKGDYIDPLKELVDNSLAAGATEINIELHCDTKYQINRLVVTDNGSGFSYDDAPVALGLAVKKGKGINEHGQGMKTAIAWFGGHNLSEGFDFLETYDGQYKYEISQLGNDGAPAINVENGIKDTYTTLSVNVHRVGVSARKFKTDWAYKLGRIYALAISNGLRIEIDQYKDGKHNADCKIAPQNPPFYNHETGSNTPMMAPIEIVTADYEATLILGRLKDDFSGDRAWKKATTGGAGVDIIKDGRAIILQSSAPLELCGKMNHPKFNGLIGRLIIKRGEGITTNPTKDNVEITEDFKALQADIAAEWKKHSISAKYPDSKKSTLKESVVRDNAHSMLAKAPFNWKNVGYESSTTFGTRMDVTGIQPGDKTKTIMEIKVEQIKPNHVNQLVGYMIAEGVEKGIMLGPQISTNAEKFITKVCKDLGFDIQFWNYNDGAYIAFRGA